MKQGIGEWILDEVLLPIGLGLIGIMYYIRHLIRKIHL